MSNVSTQTGIAGFAPAAGPANPEAIITDAAGLRVADVRISTPQGDLPVYTAAPEGAGSYPIVVVIHEIFGVHEHIRDVARRFAKQGYYALAPDLFFRHADAEAKDIAGTLREVVAKIPDAEVLADLDRTVAYAKSHGGDADRIAITGFCWGGRITWLYAAHNPHLKAAAAWYGRLAGEPTANAPRAPLDVAGELKVPVLGLYGGADQGIPLESVERLKAVLAANKTASKIVVYDDAPHAFHADYRPNYRPEPAKDGWGKLLAWFKEHGA